MGVRMKVDIEKTRSEVRLAFRRWKIDPSEWEVIYEEDKSTGARRPGATIRFCRQGTWQSISCYGFPSRGENLRQCFFLLDRLRIAEQNGVQYAGLTFTQEVATSGGTNSVGQRKQELLEAYDVLGVSPDDPVSMIEEIYRRKSLYYHPDRPGGEAEKFKKLTGAYELIMKSRQRAAG